MLKITVEVDAKSFQAQGTKESLAMFLEQFGDARVVSVEDTERAEQVKFV